MVKFSYTIKDDAGIHARPAGELVKMIKNFRCTVTVEKDGKSVDAGRILALMGLGIKKGETVTVSVEGIEEENAAKEIKEFFENKL